jgi:phosphate transport system protein
MSEGSTGSGTGQTRWLWDARLQQDIEEIQTRVRAMGEQVERALKTSLEAVLERSRPKAYSVIVRDQRIDRLEKDIDHLCLEFLLRQQPAGRHLRFAYATIKINAELERIGDYAESVARQVLKVADLQELPAPDKFREIGQVAISMLRSAVDAFLRQDAELARRTMVIEDHVDRLRGELNDVLLGAEREGRLPFPALTPLLTIARRYERVSDQAKNICEETLYMCTGEYWKHQGPGGAVRILFVDATHGVRSRMAAAIGRNLEVEGLQFLSAGLEPQPLEEPWRSWMESRGMVEATSPPQPAAELLSRHNIAVVVALEPAARSILPTPPTPTVAMEWTVPDPQHWIAQGLGPEAAAEQLFQMLRLQVQDLAHALAGE